MTSKDEVEAAVRENYTHQRTAMINGDAAALSKLLGRDFTLTHMTGYEQSKAEWLADVASGRMRYHAIEDIAVDVETDDGPPVLTARTRTEATIWGGHGTWPLQLEIHYTVTGDGRWVAERTRASTWR
ncbi:nuclear transport factor 2 family protein [Rhodococcus sp. CX]|uniref:nuclear transport factor 2 family protein n=1 Tax=Rhodococcus sp. CX TaxID=2789880 RepID=UPI0018CF4CD9|nr:nuclear transport factor 2 family protein [Rhodococcus sp. CX]MBH0121381.1 nuclear transport factor 2 family protein [Rhodococcus sp. CX]